MALPVSILLVANLCCFVGSVTSLNCWVFARQQWMYMWSHADEWLKWLLLATKSSDHEATTEEVSYCDTDRCSVLDGTSCNIRKSRFLKAHLLMLHVCLSCDMPLIRRSPINLARIAFIDAVVFLYYTAKKHNFMILGKRIADFPVISVQYG